MSASEEQEDRNAWVQVSRRSFAAFSVRPPVGHGDRGRDHRRSRADSAARQTIIGQKDRGSNAPRVKANLSSGESIFLERAGTAQADPNIRQKVDASRREISKEDIPVTKRLFGLYSEEPPATIVDAKEESRRIRENLKNGESITKGDTPTIEN